MVHELRYKGLYRYSEFCLFNLIATSFGDKCTPNKKKDKSALLLILTINTHKKDAIIHINIENINIWFQRLSYVGELGWEIYVPTEFAQDIYDKIIESGKAIKCRLKNGGELRYHSQWLRDNALDSETRDSNNGQKLLNGAETI